MTIEKSDPFGDITLQPGAVWGKQTQRSLHFFSIGEEIFSADFIDALLHIKRAAAEVNGGLGVLEANKQLAIIKAIDVILQGQYRDQFPLHVWQTGSGTQTNMNVNEVVATVATGFLQGEGQGLTVHPNDDVNQSQSSNDVFPSAMHIAAALALENTLKPSLIKLTEILSEKARPFNAILTCGRTHLMDAMPIPSGSLLEAAVSELNTILYLLDAQMGQVYQLALGGTAVGSGANAPEGFREKITQKLSEALGLPFKPHENLYAAVSGEVAMVGLNSALKSLATVLHKLANDVRLLGSGPNCGLNEWRLPANEPGSSIMPGKVNPTQCEALVMICMQVFGNELTVSMAASAGQLQLNVCRPVIIHNTLQSIRLLSEGMESFANYCIEGLEINDKQIKRNLTHNLSMATFLAPELGYDQTTQLVQKAFQDNMSLAEAAEALNICSVNDFENKLHKALMAEQT